MGDYFARLIKAALVSTLGFGGGVGLLVFLAVLITRGVALAVEYGLQAALWTGLAFSAALLCVMLPIDLFSRLALSKRSASERLAADNVSPTQVTLAGEPSPNIWQLEQTRVITLQGSLKQINSACRQALLSVPQVTTVTESPDSRSAHAQTGAGWLSTGEELKVEMSPADTDCWLVRCSSRSRSPNAVFDYGKNFHNVELWSRHMIATLKTAAENS